MRSKKAFWTISVIVALLICTNPVLAGYDPVTGRFQQQDPVGTGPRVVFTDSGPKFVGLMGPTPPSAQMHNLVRIVSSANHRIDSTISDLEVNQYVDGMNLYEYVSSNPVLFTDPLGLWKVYRDGGGIAAGEAEEGDTISKLADTVGLEGLHWRDWVTADGRICTPMGQILVSQLGLYTEICRGQRVNIPNTVIAYWAGEFGEFGKHWVGWGRDKRTLERRGFSVYEAEDLNAAGLESLIRDLMTDKQLHGIFAWGHGSYDSFATKASLKNDGAYTSYYSHWQPKYPMALGVVWACHSGDMGGAGEQFSHNSAAIFKGHPGKLLPWPFHWFGPPMSRIIRSGQQGTK